MPRVTKSFKPASTRPTASPRGEQSSLGGPKDQPSDDNTSVDQFVGRENPVDSGEGPAAPVTDQPRSEEQQPQQYPSSESRYSDSQSSSGGYRPRYGSPRYAGGAGNGGGYQNGNRDYSERDRDVPTEEVSGILDVMPEGHGFLRPKYTPSDRDVYISASQIRRFQLRSGDFVEGAARPPKETERYFGLLQVNTVNGSKADELVALDGRAKKRTKFEDLTAIYPNRHLKLETGKTPLSQRVIDLVAPIGFGQRGLIVSPPKAGKTSILKDLATGITKNHPEVVLMAVLVGERPEEVTDLSRSIKGDVISSNFDEPAEAQTAAAEIALERAKRLVEMGKDVVILLDSITRLGRAYNLSVPPSGRTLSGGFDPVALYPPKHFFGAARNCEQGGSLTIIGTALVDTGSRMDDLIYEEFKGTGNMELHLDRVLAERRIFPAINIGASGTRQEQLLFGGADSPEYKLIVVMMRMMGMLGDNERTEIFLDRLGKTESNADFLKTLKDAK